MEKSQNYNMEFGMRLARRLIIDQINNNSKKNLAMSPLLIHMSLNMLASGCTGQTLEQLLGFLESDSVTHLNDQSSFFLEFASRENPGGPQISMVNGVWVDQRFPLKPSFKQLAEDVYKANAQSVDFLNQGEQIKKEINSWAREASKGNIDPLITDPLSEDTIVVFTKALYFQARWFAPFVPWNNADEDFHLLNGETVKVPFMKKMYAYYYYGSFEGFQLIKMDYECGESYNKRYAMYIFLPDKSDGLQELVEKFNRNPKFIPKNSELKNIMLKNVWLPKLKFEYELDSKEMMKKMGLNLPFDTEKAEIKEMVENSEGVVYVSKSIQKSYIEVNEKGTLAAAIAESDNDIGFGIDEIPQIDFIADHPFLFMIKEAVSDTTLFVGVALNPLSS